jgi:hypothetical protein
MRSSQKHANIDVEKKKIICNKLVGDTLYTRPVYTQSRPAILPDLSDLEHLHSGSSKGPHSDFGAAGAKFRA